jgi:hypothetical protein
VYWLGFWPFGGLTTETVLNGAALGAWILDGRVSLRHLDRTDRRKGEWRLVQPTSRTKSSMKN